MLARLKNLKLALELERKAEMDRFTSLIEQQSIATRIEAGITLYPLEFINETYNRFEDLELHFKINEHQDPNQFSSNGKVQLFTSHNEEKLTGIIIQFKADILSIQLSDSDSPEWLKKGKLGLDILPDTRTADVQLKTIDRILKDELRIVNQFYNTGKPDDYAVTPLIFDGFNPSQNNAISQLLSSNTFHIIHGPPGTGKTKTITKAIIELVAQDKKIIVAAPSNAAVDHITHEIAKELDSVVRIGNSFKIAEKIIPFTLSHKVLNDPLMDVVNRLKKEGENIRKKAFKYVRNFDKEASKERRELRHELREIRKDIRKIENEITWNCIQSATVVTGTFIGLQRYGLHKLDFDAVFVDEAGQALEPAIWSIAHLAPKLYLAGDPLQLSPTLFSEEAKRLGLGKSLVEIGIKNGISTSLLDTQYRMNDKIMQFSNTYFYENKLKTDQSVADIRLLNDTFGPIEFIDTAGCGFEEKREESGAILNEGEITILNQRLTEIDEVATIGIISPYRKQVNALQLAIPEHENNCQTIDSFQGQERDIILISLVRSNDEGVIGFLSDYRRMNVAMTRAKKKLIIIGDSATIGGNPFYQSLLNYIEENGAYRSAWEFMT